MQVYSHCDISSLTTTGADWGPHLHLSLATRADILPGAGHLLKPDITPGQGAKVEESEKVKEFKVAVEDGPDLGDFIAEVVPRWVVLVMVVPRWVVVVMVVPG